MRARPLPLSETGCEVDLSPLLVLWGARALYIGPAFDLSPHRSAVAVLAFGLDGSFGIANDPHDPVAGYTSSRALLIAPNTLHHLQPHGAMAFLYLDPISRDYAVIQARLRRSGDGSAFDPGDVAGVIDCLTELRLGAKSWLETAPELVRRLGLHILQGTHPRIADAIARLRNNPSHETTATDLADTAGLSLSRFLHLFTEATGLPFRRYRTWCRLRLVVRDGARGVSLTEAAHAAGLASSAHLSAAFRDMFGMAPSALNLRNVTIIEAD